MIYGCTYILHVLHVWTTYDAPTRSGGLHSGNLFSGGVISRITEFGYGHAPTCPRGCSVWGSTLWGYIFWRSNLSGYLFRIRKCTYSLEGSTIWGSTLWVSILQGVTLSGYRFRMWKCTYLLALRIYSLGIYALGVYYLRGLFSRVTDFGSGHAPTRSESLLSAGQLLP